MNEAADKFFVGNAQLLKRLVTLENSLSANTNFVLPSNAELVNIIGDMGGILPLGRPPDTGRSPRPPAGTPDPQVRSVGGPNGS